MRAPPTVAALAALAIALGAGAGTNSVAASGFASARFGGEHGQVTATNPTALYFNPAGAEGANTGNASLTNLFGGPMLGASLRAGRWAFGAGVFAPFGGRAHWNQNPRFAGDPSFPDAAAGVQRWHTIDGALTVVYFSVGAAARLGPLAIGASGNLIRSAVSTTQARNIFSGTPDTLHESRVVLDVSGWQGSFGLGAMLEADRKSTRLNSSH